jgi:DegV family protein with EDD domain
MPKKAAPPPELFAEQLQCLAAVGDPILCLHPSTELSGTVRSKSVAAREFPEADIRVIDTRTIAGNLATMVRLAAGWASDGVDADTIQARLRQVYVPGARTYLLVSTLEYLARGGRIGGAWALLGSILQI